MAVAAPSLDTIAVALADEGVPLRAIARATRISLLGPKAVEKVELLPIGRGQPEGQPAQPTLMQGAAARQLLENLRSRSAALDTSMAIDAEEGVIAVSQTNK
jgi:hypothetical protein